MAHIAWERVRAVYAQALRSRLAEKYAPATANKVIAAVKGSRLPAGRALLRPASLYHQSHTSPIPSTRNPLARTSYAPVRNLNIDNNKP